MSRRVLHIVDSLGHSGVAAQCLALSRGLVQKGFDVHVVALRGGGRLLKEFASAGATTVELNRRWVSDPLVFGRLQGVIARSRPDVIHAWNPDSVTCGLLASYAAPGSRILVGYHRINPGKANFAWVFDRALARRSARLIAGGAPIRDWYVTHGLSTSSFSVIAPGLAEALPSDVTREELLRDLQVPENAKLIGVVGRLDPEKRVKDLIWAADLLRVLHDNLRLLIIGDGMLRPQLEQYARMASDLDHVRFLGQRPDVWRIMPHLDVVWNANEPRGPSIAILEAMAAGVPVIASDTPFNRELVSESETGYLIPLGDRAGRAVRARHTDRIFTDSQLASRLAAASRQRAAEHFNLERMIRQYVDVYQDGSR